jgi:pre-rRNA-processing protein TSR1
MHVQTLPENPAAVTQVRKSLLSFLKHFFPALERVFSPVVPSEASNLLRSLGEKLPKGVIWRESRARLLVEQVEWLASSSSNGNGETAIDEPVASTSALQVEEVGTLAVTGVVRGSNFSANRLVHIQGFGDYQVEKVGLPH